MVNALPHFDSSFCYTAGAWSDLTPTELGIKMCQLSQARKNTQQQFEGLLNVTQRTNALALFGVIHCQRQMILQNPSENFL